MTKVKTQGGSPSRHCCIFSLSDLFKLPEKLVFGLYNALQLNIGNYNSDRTTILYHKIDTCKSRKVAKSQNVKKLPNLFSNF